jgi:hypothetical protein
MGFESNPVDNSLFQRTVEGKVFYVLVYVDDLVLAADCPKELGEFKEEMSRRFTMTDLGELRYYLGLHVARDNQRGTIQLHQRRYIEELLEKFGMAECKAVKTPLPTDHDLTLPEPWKEGEEEEMKGVPYAQLVGSLMYVMTCTRPELAYPAALLSRYMAVGVARKKHWVAAKRVLRYLKGTKDHGIVLGGASRVELRVEVDSSWADDLSDRKSTQGFVATLGLGPISWKSQRSPAVALSTTEAEYYAAGLGGREVMHLRQLLDSLGHPQTAATTLWCDNQSAVAISANAEFRSRTKHIDIRHHWIREQVEEGHLQLEYIATEHNSADLMTKALGEPKHLGFMKMLHIRGPGERS